MRTSNPLNVDGALCMVPRLTSVFFRLVNRKNYANTFPAGSL
jgi:hypothetical protein